MNWSSTESQSLGHWTNALGSIFWRVVILIPMRGRFALYTEPAKATRFLG
jgi:hypothetical protein